MQIKVTLVAVVALTRILMIWSPTMQLCTLRLQNKLLFQGYTLYNILACFSDLPNRPEKFMWKTLTSGRRSQETAQGISPSRFRALSIVYACSLTAHETYATKRLLELGLVPRERAPSVMNINLRPSNKCIAAKAAAVPTLLCDVCLVISWHRDIHQVILLGLGYSNMLLE